MQAHCFSPPRGVAMETGGSNYALRGRAAREDVGGDSNADALALGGGPSMGGGDALLTLSDWEGLEFVQFDTRGAAPACEVLGDELGTSSPHLSVCDFTATQRPPTPLTRLPQPSLRDTLRSDPVAWGHTKRIKFSYIPQHRSFGRDAPPPPPALHRRDEGDHVSMRTRKEEVVAPVGKARQIITCNTSLNSKGEDKGNKIGSWNEKRYKKCLHKVHSVLQSRGPTKDSPLTRNELLRILSHDIPDNGLLQTLLKEVVGQAPEGSSKKVCRHHDPLTGRYVYWLEGIEAADSPQNIRPESMDISIQQQSEVKRLMMDLNGAVMDLKGDVMDIIQQQSEVKRLMMDLNGDVMDLKGIVMEMKDVLEQHVNGPAHIQK